MTLFVCEKFIQHLQIQWGIDGRDFMKRAKSAGVDTLRSCDLPCVLSTRNKGILVGAWISVERVELESMWSWTDTLQGGIDLYTGTGAGLYAGIDNMGRAGRGGTD